MQDPKEKQEKTSQIAPHTLPIIHLIALISQIKTGEFIRTLESTEYLKILHWCLTLYCINWRYHGKGVAFSSLTWVENKKYLQIVLHLLKDLPNAKW